jgi:hypothetical protein
MTSPGGSAKPLSQQALRLLVTDLAGKIDQLEQEVEQLRLDNSNLRLDNQAWIRRKRFVSEFQLLRSRS